MIKSMTGFGRSEVSDYERKLIVEMKSVNHRYCDISIRMSKKLSFFEAGIRKILKDYIQRGKIDIYITCEEYTETNVSIKYNKEAAGTYLKYLREMGEEFQISSEVTALELSAYPDVFITEEQTQDEEKLWEILEKAVRIAAQKFVETRMTEGEQLDRDIQLKLVGMLEDVAFIETRSPQILVEYRDKITEKVKELLGNTQIDEGILATELTMYADKICVDEETVRLRSHIKNMQETLKCGDGVGRKLDFIAQEMNREANTILSKANDLELSNRAIDLKTEIEKIREQIQNIE